MTGVSGDTEICKSWGYVNASEYMKSQDKRFKIYDYENNRLAYADLTSVEISYDAYPVIKISFKSNMRESGCVHDVTCTPDTEFLMKKNNETVWVKAKDLNEGDYFKDADCDETGDVRITKIRTYEDWPKSVIQEDMYAFNSGKNAFYLKCGVIVRM